MHIMKPMLRKHRKSRRKSPLRRRILGTGIAAIIALSFAPESVRAQIFAPDISNNTVGTYNAVTGAAINASFLTGISTGWVGVAGLAVSGSNLFVSDQGLNTVHEYDAATGATINSNFITGLTGPFGITISGSNLFVANSNFGTGSNTVGEYNITTGAAINASLVTGLLYPTGVAVSGNSLFVNDWINGSVGSYNATTGTVINASLFTGLANPYSIAVGTVGPARPTHWLGGTDGKWTGDVNNWASDASGTATTAIPTSTDDITFSANGAGNRSTTLEQDFTIHSLTIGDTSPVTINSGSGGAHTLTVSGNAGTGLNAQAGARLVTIGANLTLAGSSDTITVNNSGVVLNGSLSGSNGLIKLGNGTLTLAGPSTYTGGTTVNAGTLTVDSNGTTTFGTLGGGPVTNNSGTLSFVNSASAGNATVTNKGGAFTGAIVGQTFFNNSSTAGSATFINTGGSAASANGGQMRFYANSTAGSGTFTNEGGTAAGAYGAYTAFLTSSSAGSGIFTVNGAAASGNAQGGSLAFIETSTAANGTFTTNGGKVSGAYGGSISFDNTATAGTASFTTNGGMVSGAQGGTTQLKGTSTAGSGTFTTNGGAVSGAVGGNVSFSGSATAGNAIFTTNGNTVAGATEGTLSFRDTSTAGNGIFITNAGVGNGSQPGTIYFQGNATAGNGNFTNNGSAYSGTFGGAIRFNSNSTAGSGTFTLNGGSVAGAYGGYTAFYDTSSAGNAMLIANGGIGGGFGGLIYFWTDSTGGTSRVRLLGNGNLDISTHNAPGVTIGSLEGSGNAYLGSNNLTVGGNNLTTTFSGVLQDSGFIHAGGAGGSLTKVGAGSLYLTGINTYTGNTNINAGTLFVDGSIASPNTFVNAGGTLGGTGSVLGHVVNNGFVSPGHSPGTLTVGGNYTQMVGGTLQIAVAGAQPGQFSVLAVGGHASLAGALQVVQYGAATLKPGDTLKILTAVGGVSGTFSTAVNPFATGALLGMNVIYEANDVLLTFTQNTVTQALAAVSPFTTVTPNQTAVARALDKVLADPRAAQVINFLNSEPLGRIPGDLDRLGPADLTAIFHLATSLANIQTANVQRRLEEIRSDGASDITVPGGSVTNGRGAYGPKGAMAQSVAPAEDLRWGMWFTGSGEFTNVGSTTNAAGFSLDSGGVTAGVDYRFTDKFAAGISLGYMNTTASLANNGEIDVNGGRIGAYATWFDRGLHLDASVTGGINGYATRRTAPNATSSTASPQGTEVNLLFAAGYDWKWKGLTIGPTASFQYTNMQLNGFTETGTFAPLNVQTKTADSARTALGFHASYDMKVGRAIVRPEARVSWQHEFGDTSYSLTSTFATLGGNPFTVAGPATGRDSMLVRAGVSVQCTERLSAYAYYDGELFRQNYSSNNVSVGFRLRF